VPDDSSLLGCGTVTGQVCEKDHDAFICMIW